jgi:hypothetical protein
MNNKMEEYDDFKKLKMLYMMRKKLRRWNWHRKP